jgi:histidinol-phosphate aminotransferase
MSLERDNVARLSPYTPGEQPGNGPVIKLNTNENPYPPAPAVIEAIRGVTADALRRYPPPRADGFRQVAASAHGLSPEQVIATNGGDELLRMAVTAFCDPARGGGETAGGLGVAEPSYSLYDVLAAIHDTPVTHIGLGPDWSIPADFAERLNRAGCRLALLVNPHAPSGTLTPVARLERIAREFRGVLLIDEAYVDFAQTDALSLLDPQRGLQNVLLLRSLSKGYSLAGLRFGYGLGCPALITTLHKIRDSYNTDILAQTAAIAALGHRAEAKKTWQAVVAERSRLAAELHKRGMQTPPSQSNFLLATCPPGRPSAPMIYEALKTRGVLVRYFDQERLRDKLRITIGTPAQNNALLAALDKVA